MKKYRVVELMGGGYGIQCKKGFFSFWKLLPVMPIQYSSIAYIKISELKKVDEEETSRKKSFKVKNVHKIID